MTSDHFEKAMQGIATNAAENGGPTISDVLTALVAENDDNKTRHRESTHALQTLVADGITCDSRISALETWRDVSDKMEVGQDAARFRAAGLARGVLSDAASTAAAQELGAKPIARLVAQASHAQEPEWFTTAPAFAARKALERAGMTLSQIDLFEVNEAFAVVAMAFIRDLDVDPNKVNVNGGAVALGHPIGSSGARIVTTLIHALRARKKRYGLASICIGGGEATAVVVEAL